MLDRTPAICPRCDGCGVASARAEGAAAAARAAAEARGDALVGVVGGGVGGAALALALQQRGVRVVVFERDESFDARAQVHTDYIRIRAVFRK